MEYAAILLLLKKRRKPKYSIDAGLKKMFNNGDATQPLQGRTSGGPSSPTSAAALEEAKRTVIIIIISGVILSFFVRNGPAATWNCLFFEKKNPGIFEVD